MHNKLNIKKVSNNQCDRYLQESTKPSPPSMGGHSFRDLTTRVSGCRVDVSDGSRIGIGLSPKGFGQRQRQSRPDRVPCGTLWPHGEFSLGYTPVESEDDNSRIINRAGFGGDVESMRACVARVAMEGSPSALGLSLPSNPHTLPKRPQTYGRLGITAIGKKKVRAAATLLQRRYGRKRLSFLTLTIPPLSQDNLRRLVGKWGELMRVFQQWLARKLDRLGLPSTIVSVTECQPRRALSGDLGCLHIHVVYVGRSGPKKAWALSPLDFRGWWLSTISRLAGCLVEGFPCEELRMVRASAAGYLGKYMSKGGSAAASLAAVHGWECLPRQWWNMTAAMRDWVKAETRNGQRLGVLLDAMVNAYFDGDNPRFPGVLFCYQVDSPGGPVTVGYYGRLSESERLDAIAILDGVSV